MSLRHFIFLLFTASSMARGQDIVLTVHEDDIPYPAFIGGSTEFMYPILRGIPNADTSAYDSVFLSGEALEKLSGLNLNYLRFPGGTISQFYHFSGANGYGTTDFDLNCRPGYINIGGFKEKVNVDAAYPENMIEQYIALHKDLEEAQGNSINTLYVINLMSHYFAGDLVPVNEVLDGLINNYSSELGALLQVSPAYLTDAQVIQVEDIMLTVFNDPIIMQLNGYLLQQEGFQFRAAENLAAINHLISAGIPIGGVELGNENYAFLMLQDDDLSEIPFDCTTPDSIIQQYGPLSLPLKAYMQAILKYGMLSNIYAVLIDELFSLPTGAVITAGQFNVDPTSFETFEINEVRNEKFRYYELWNRFVGRLDYYNAVIPHIYMKEQPDCSVFDVIARDSIELYGRNYIDFYFEEVLEYQLGRLADETRSKPMWITEWNINTANIYGNTFLHGSYLFQFMNELNRIDREYDIDLINFHNLAAWRYNQFALLRTDEDSTGYKVNLQSLYEPFKLMGELHDAGYPRCDAALEDWLGEASTSTGEHYYSAYFDADATRLILHFINQSGTPVNIPFDGRIFNVNTGGGLLENLQVSGYDLNFIDAESLLSSNEGCRDYPQLFDNYTREQSSGTEPSINLPGYSFGRLALSLEQAAGIPDTRLADFRINPNPASGAFTIQFSGIPSARVAIFDSAGKLRHTASVTSGSITNTRDLNDGMYFIRLEDDDGVLYGTKKLFVTNKR